NRIDSVRDELVGMIGETNKRIDTTNERIDATNQRIDTTNERIDSVRDELVGMIRETNKRLDRLYEVIVRREEHDKIETRVAILESKLADIERKLAA
ncbi:MAG: hypothetical protein DRG83_20330, partial [Deltaproteobacteria bacterium]